MRWIDILSWSMNNLRQRKLRSALTMLGVVIGTMAIVVTISLGYGAQETQMKQLEEMTNLRQIQVYPYWGSYSSDGSTARITKITDQVVSRIRRVKNISAVSPVIQVYSGLEFVLTTGKYEAVLPLIAVSPTDIGKFVPIRDGRGFTGSTDRMEFLVSEVAMMEFRDPKKSDDDEYIDIWSYLESGEDMPLPNIDWMRAQYDLQLRWEDYENTDASGDPVIKTKDYKARIVGTLKFGNANDSNLWTFGTGAVVNINWLKKMQRENKALFKEMGMPDLNDYQTVYVLANSIDDVEGIVKELRDMGLQPDNPLMWVQQMQEQIATVQGFLGFIGAVSMIVAALMIANTMMMSIYERTREIGVMKVIGCRLGNIRMMFLTEAAYIGLIGGLLGLALSYAASWALNNVEALQQLVASVMASTAMFSDGDTTSVIPTSLALGTWIGVIAISVLSGMYPAQRAMQLSSLAAIRNAD